MYESAWVNGLVTWVGVWQLFVGRGFCGWLFDVRWLGFERLCCLVCVLCWLGWLIAIYGF